MSTIKGLIYAFLLSMFGLCPVVAHAADAAVPVKAKPIVSLPPFFTFVDNRLTYAYVYHTTDAGYYSPKSGGSYNGNTNMHVLAFTHFDTWAYGTNFLNILGTRSDHNDPSGPCTNAGVVTSFGGTVAANCAGATDVYAILRSTFGFNEVFSTKAFSFGPLRNVSLEVGGDLENQNSYVASAARKGYVGLQFAFELPYNGYVNVAPLYKMETGHNGFTQCGTVFASPSPACNADGNVKFKNTWALEINYAMDLGFLPESMQYFMISGRVGIYGPKGPIYGLPGFESTKTEINSEPIRLTFDASKAFWGPQYSHFVDYWVAYRFWKNQYGYDEKSAPFVCTVGGISTNSCTANTVATGITVKF